MNARKSRHAGLNERPSRNSQQVFGEPCVDGNLQIRRGEGGRNSRLQIPEVDRRSRDLSARVEPGSDFQVCGTGNGDKMEGNLGAHVQDV